MHRLFDDLIAGLKHAAELVWVLVALVVGTLIAAQVVKWLWDWAHWTPRPLFP